MIFPECLPHPHYQLLPDFVNDLNFKFLKSILISKLTNSCHFQFSVLLKLNTYLKAVYCYIHLPT